MRHFPVGAWGRVWEPAAGNHLIADVLREHGADVVTSDIVTYDRQHDGIFDFLIDGTPSFPAGCTNLYTNPPYGKGNRDAVRFAEQALLRCSGCVALLLTAKFDFGKTRHHLFRDNGRFMAKIVLTDRIQWFPGDSTGTEDHAWYVWSCEGFSMEPKIIYEGKR